MMHPLLLAAALAAPGEQPLTPIPLLAPAPLLQDEEAASSTEWEGSVTLGASTSTGNTEVSSVTAGVDASRATESETWAFQFNSVLNQEKGEDGKTNTTQRRNEANLKYEHNLTDRLYAYGTAGAMSDLKAELDLRSGAGAGAGYKILTEGPWILDGELGLTYLNELFKEDALGQQERNEYLAVHAGYFAGWTSEDERLKFSHRGDLYPSVDGGDDGEDPGFYRMDTSFRMNLTESFFTQFQWLYTRTEVPQADKKKSDNLFLVTVGWGF